MNHFTFCRGCGEKTETVYCAKCAETAKCPHGNKVGECDPCDVAGDFAADAAREQR